MAEINVGHVVGPQGPKGDPGPQGAMGPGATVQGGTVTMTPSGSPATVTNVGTAQDAVLDFTLPFGPKGDAATVTLGKVTRVPYRSEARVENVGDGANAIFDFYLPEGPSGPGTGDMLRSYYDADDDGVVDNAARLGGKEPDYYTPAAQGLLDGTPLGERAQVQGLANLCTQYAAHVQGSGAAAADPGLLLKAKSFNDPLITVDAEWEVSAGYIETLFSKLAVGQSVALLIVYSNSSDRMRNENWMLGTIGAVDIQAHTIQLAQALNLEENFKVSKVYAIDVPPETASQGLSHVEGCLTFACGDAAHAQGYGTYALNRASHAEGNNTVASGLYAHAEGEGVKVSGRSSHAEGQYTTATGHWGDHAEGQSTIASGGHGAHAEGYKTAASGESSHAEGNNTVAGGLYAHAEGYDTTASGDFAHAEGRTSIAPTRYSHAEGYYTIASGTGAHAEGVAAVVETVNRILKIVSYAGAVITIDTSWTHSSGYIETLFTQIEPDQAIQIWGEQSGYLPKYTNYKVVSADTVAHTITLSAALPENYTALWAIAVDAVSGYGADGAHAEGLKTLVTKKSAHAEGYLTQALGAFSHVEGCGSIVTGQRAHAECSYTKATGNYSHAEGGSTMAGGSYSHAEGYTAKANGDYGDHAEGQGTIASGGHGAHAEGYKTAANGQCSHAEGGNTVASGNYSHAEGNGPAASGESSHAEGGSTIAGGRCSHAEGYCSKANGNYGAHAEGGNTVASGNYSHAEGNYTTASSDNAHAEGKFSIAPSRGSHAEGYYTIASGTGAHAEGVAAVVETVNRILKIASCAGTVITIDTAWTHSSGYIETLFTKIQPEQVIQIWGKQSGYLPGYTNYKVVSADAAAHTITLSAALPENYTALWAIAVGAVSGNGANGAHAEGVQTLVTMEGAHAEGCLTQALGFYSHAEGCGSIATGQRAHAECSYTKAFGDYSHAEGASTMAGGSYSHAEGYSVKANGNYGAHAEGYNTAASGESSHAEGDSTMASGSNSHAEGIYTIANASAAHAEGNGNLAVNGVLTVSSYEGAVLTIDSTWIGSVKYLDNLFAQIQPKQTAYVVGTLPETSKTQSYAVVAADATAYTVTLDGQIPENSTIYYLYLPQAADSAGVTKPSYAHSEGFRSLASGPFSHAEGVNAKAIGKRSHAEGSYTIASGEGSHAEGGSTHAGGGYTHAEGNLCKAYYLCSHAEGLASIAHEQATHAEGQFSVAYGWAAHAEGMSTAAVGRTSHAEGNSTVAGGSALKIASYTGAVATIDFNWAGSRTYISKVFESIKTKDRVFLTGITHDSAKYCCQAFQVVAIDTQTKTITLEREIPNDFDFEFVFVSNSFFVSTHAEGQDTIANGECAHAEGKNTVAGSYQHVSGRFNSLMDSPTDQKSTTGSLFMIGKGTDDNARANAFRVSTDGHVYGCYSYASSGADYAELFEWLDGNPDRQDRRGLFVTLDGEKIRLANADDDYILGVISGNPVVLGNQYADQWQGMYIKDVFGTTVWEEYTEDAFTDENGIEHPAVSGRREKLNPDYKPDGNYVPRSERPEWGTVGMFGQLTVIDDGSCIVNEYCRANSNGTATASDKGYRVIARLDDTHIRIIFR